MRRKIQKRNEKLRQDVASFKVRLQFSKFPPKMVHNLYVSFVPMQEEKGGVKKKQSSKQRFGCDSSLGLLSFVSFIVYHSIEFLIVPSFNFLFLCREAFHFPCQREKDRESSSPPAFPLWTSWAVSSLSVAQQSSSLFVASFLPPPQASRPLSSGVDHLTRHCLHLQIARLSANCPLLGVHQDQAQE